jgi:hypothetical protein
MIAEGTGTDYASLFEFVKHLLVALAAGVIVDWKKRKRRRERIELANNEILQTMRTLTGKQTLPGLDRLNAVFSSNAKKYGVNREELYSISSLSDDATTDVMNDPYLSSEQADEYCALIKQFRSDNLPARTAAISESRSRWRADTSVILGAAVLAAVLLSFMSTQIKAGSLAFDIKEVFWMGTIAITIPAFLFWVLDLYRDYHKGKEGNGHRSSKGLFRRIYKRRRTS